MGSWKREFASGLILLGPILITLYVVYRITALVTGVTPLVLFDDGTLGGLVAHEPTRSLLVAGLRVVLPLCVVALVTLGAGVLTRTTIGDVFARSVDGLANRVPGLRIVYNASKVTAETTLGEGETLQSAVRVESWDGLQMTAFKTGRVTDDGREVVFIPTSPNISSGFVAEVEPERVTETDEGLEEALTRVLSGGFAEADAPSTTGTAGDANRSDDSSGENGTAVSFDADENEPGPEE
ncbi:DUF502 domain-containing protein [Natrinema salifodinae]|uniref:Uncharacterized membrane protein n=1 Tax=Natrinema salifodinae TaxID=1202768 RepID=A0A1I0PDK2_9EURY|nr:DUF502 domain-containing protein [Natrinema salifodinae]SEW12289.1 Uncharacterized membrane protein [Natrinema salifodinae]